MGQPPASITALAVVVSALFLGGCTRTGLSRDAQRREDSQLASTASTPRRGGADVQQRASATLAAVVQAVTTEHSFTDLSRRLCGAECGKLLTVDLADDAELNAAAHRFQATWKQLYGHPFYLLDHAQVVFSNDASIAPGEGGEGARLAAARITPDGADQPAASSAAELIHVDLPPLQGAPSVHATLREEPDGTFRILVPPTAEATQLKARLIHGLDALSADHHVWPESPAAAERIVAQRLLAAIVSGQPPQATY
jgi:hypothetical protein